MTLIVQEMLKIQIHFWRNIVHFWKLYICSHKLDVQEANCRFTQFNRIWNYLIGHWTETGSYACSGIMGIWLFLFLDAWIRLQTKRGDMLILKVVNNLKGRSTCKRILIVLETRISTMIERKNKNILWTVTKSTGQTSDLKECSTFWIMMIFPQTSNFRIKNLCFMCLRTTKQWLTWSSREGVPQWEIFPGPTELRLIDCSIDPINLDPKIQIKYIDTENKLADIQTNGNFTLDEWNNLLYLLLLISVPHVLTQCRKDVDKIQKKNESAKSKRMMNLSRNIMKNLPSRNLPLHSKVRGKPYTKVKLF